jgi:CubicO group peptidase (beta-lactamase class C family)
MPPGTGRVSGAETYSDSVRLDLETRTRCSRAQALRRRRLWAVSALSLLLASLGSAGVAAELDAFEEWVRSRLAETNVPSLVAAAARDGEVLWAKGFGWADREREIPAMPETPYSLASVSKPFTATALMVLVERGAVDLDRPIQEYLGELRLVSFHEEDTGPTVRQVANHTAGLPVHYRFFAVEGGELPPPMAVTIARYGRLVRAPGERYEYANLGYGVLEHLVERVSGRPHEQFLREAVLEPLGLDHASAPSSPAEAAGAAARYGLAGELLPFYDTDHRGASAVYASARDLLRFGELHLGLLERRRREASREAPVLSRRALREMQRPTSRTDDGAGYGVGWRIETHRRGFTVVGHRGGMPGVTSALLLLPEPRLVVVVLSNARTDLVHEVSERLFAELLPPFPEALAGSLEHAPRRERAAPPKRHRPRLPRRLLGDWTGAVDVGGVAVPVELTIRRREVLARLDGAPAKAWLVPAYRDRALRGVLDQTLPSSDLAGRPHRVRFELREHTRDRRLRGAATAVSVGLRLPFAVSHPVWMERRVDAGRRDQARSAGSRASEAIAAGPPRLRRTYSSLRVTVRSPAVHVAPPSVERSSSTS